MKTYTFVFSHHPCVFEDGLLSFTFDLFGTNNNKETREVKVMTWSEAKAYFLEFVEKAPKPAACNMMCSSRRAPPGYKQFTTTVYKQDN
jgi:hypothetical protein